LREFAGTKVVLTSVPEWEPRRFAGQLRLLFQFAEWEAEDGPLEYSIAVEGVEVWYVRGKSVPPPPPGSTEPVTPKFNEQGQRAAEALVTELRKQNLDARTLVISEWADSTWPQNVPRTTLIVRVGPKSQMYFLERSHPEIKAAREQMNRVFEEGLKRLEEDRARVFEQMRRSNEAPSK
jgi:hypothetical protein